MIEAGIKKKAVEFWYSNVLEKNRTYQPVVQSQKDWIDSTQVQKIILLGNTSFIPDHFFSYLFIKGQVSAEKAYREKITVGGTAHNTGNIGITGFYGMDDQDSIHYRSIFNPVNIIHQPLDKDLFEKVNTLYQTWWDKEKLDYKASSKVSLLQLTPERS